MKRQSMLTLVPVTDAHKSRLQAAAPGLSMEYATISDVTQAQVAGASIIFGNIPRILLPAATALQWLALSTAGSDAYTAPGVLPESVLLTSAVGAYGLSVSEHMLALLLSAFRLLPTYHDAQREHVWRPAGQMKSIDGSVILVVGTGDIGGEFARKAKALGAYVIGIRRNMACRPAYLDELHPLEALDTLLPKADVVAVVLPAGEQTNGLFSRDRFARMKRDALFINVGRGSVVDTDALTEALSSGSIGGACLDTVNPEPLPSDHPLWRMENVILTPHVAGMFYLPETLNRVVAIMCDNLRRYLSGQPLRNLVDRQAGKR